MGLPSICTRMSITPPPQLCRSGNWIPKALNSLICLVQQLSLNSLRFSMLELHANDATVLLSLDRTISIAPLLSR